MIDEDQARRIAQKALDSRPTRAPMMLDPGTIDHGEYWVFPFNSVEYYETDDLAVAYVGAGPIAVAKSDGSVRFLRSSRPFEEQLPPPDEGMNLMIDVD